MIGSAAVNVLLLGIADAVLGRDALTAASQSRRPFLQGTLGMILLVILAAGITAGEVAVLGVGIASTVLFILCVGAIWLCSGYEHRHVWTVVEPGGEPGEER